MPADLVALVDDVAAETAALRAILDPLPDASWLLPTPAPGWTIADQVSHLAYFDEVAVTSATDPDAFAAILARIDSGGGVDPDVIAAEHRRLSPAQLRDWFARTRARAALGLRRPGSSRPGAVVRAADERRFVADGTADGDLGAWPGHRGHRWRAARADATAPARRAHRRRRPRVQLHRARPAGAARAGAGRARRAVRRAVDLGTGRRSRSGHRPCARLLPAGHPAAAPGRYRRDRRGPVAEQWLTIAQAFAGPPGAGRTPGQFRTAVAETSTGGRASRC